MTDQINYIEYNFVVFHYYDILCNQNKITRK